MYICMHYVQLPTTSHKPNWQWLTFTMHTKLNYKQKDENQKKKKRFSSTSSCILWPHGHMVIHVRTVVHSHFSTLNECVLVAHPKVCYRWSHILRVWWHSQWVNWNSPKPDLFCFFFVLFSPLCTTGCAVHMAESKPHESKRKAKTMRVIRAICSPAHTHTHTGW